MAADQSRRAHLALALVFVLFTIGLGAAACGGSSSKLSSNPDRALTQVQDAIDTAGGYSVRITGQNLVLPDWGGVDNGTVQVNGEGNQSTATLQRTGEPGATYSMRLVDGSTYFQRSTCKQVFRVPGGAPQVLTPFILQTPRGYEPPAMR